MLINSTAVVESAIMRTGACLLFSQASCLITIGLPVLGSIVATANGIEIESSPLKQILPIVSRTGSVSQV